MSSLWKRPVFAFAVLSLAAIGCSSGSSSASSVTLVTASASPSPAASATAAARSSASPSAPSPSPTASASVASNAYTCPSASTSSGTLNCTTLPLGDLKYTTAGPQTGYVYVCSAPPSGQPVVSSAPWLGTTTWNLSTKIVVEGAVTWQGSFSSALSSDGSTRTITSNGVLISPYASGTFPIQSSDPAYQYDRNPNSIATKSYSFALPASPTVAASPACVPPGGTIAIALTGVAIYNAFDANGYDAVARELQDDCHGHPDQSSTYHMHGDISACSADAGSAVQNSSLLGYSLDGFGIYGPWYAGKILTSADLDACHGTTSAVMWDGKLTTMYHYVSTYDFPYTIGCYAGTPIET